ncbi:RNA methyltransferase [Telmatobacter bradus]|uniref:RNA methyltransferase n=1 Tax=Telmatobacter bradus TaxID=474953 RepID=UPI003B42E1CA
MTNATEPALDVVLVRPRNPLNIGSAARAMANFGLQHLTVVDAYEPHWREARTAVEAEDLLQNASAVSTLAEAVASATLVVGTGSLTYRKPEQAIVQLPNLAPHIRQELANATGRVALVFGSEKHGLTREDLSWCHMLVEIPTSPRQPSMNLAQAVAVCLYELSTRAFTQSEVPAAAPTAAPATESVTSSAEARPASTELDRLATLIEEAMLAARYSPAHMRTANLHDLRLMLRRLQFSGHDLRHTLGLFRRILWRIGQK